MILEFKIKFTTTKNIQSPLLGDNESINKLIRKPLECIEYNEIFSKIITIENDLSQNTLSSLLADIYGDYLGIYHIVELMTTGRTRSGLNTIIYMSGSMHKTYDKLIRDTLLNELLHDGN